MANLHSMDTGFGVDLGGGSGKVYRWNAHSFNPNSIDQGLVASDWNLGTYAQPWAIDSQTVNFDCAGFQSGNEVVAGVIVVTQYDGDPPSSFTISMKDGVRTMLSFTFFMPTPVGGNQRWWAWMGVGIRSSSVEEIHKNSGNYSFQVTGAVSNTINFTTSNVDITQADTLLTSSKGYLWVYGEYLWFINAHGNKTYIRHDGTNYGAVGVGNAGYIWFETTEQKIYYVDENGDKRRTKKASHYQYWSDVDLGNVGAGDKGYLYDKTSDDHFLYMSMPNGDLVRIGPGYLYGDMQ